MNQSKRVDTQLIDKLETWVNTDLISYDTTLSVLNNTMELDYGVIEPGVVSTDMYLAVVLDGTFHSVLD